MNDKVAPINPPSEPVKVAVVPPELMQQLFDTIRDYVPHKPAESILSALKKVQYADFTVKPEKDG